MTFVGLTVNLMTKYTLVRVTYRRRSHLLDIYVHPNFVRAFAHSLMKQKRKMKKEKENEIIKQKLKKRKKKQVKHVFIGLDSVCWALKSNSLRPIHTFKQLMRCKFQPRSGTNARFKYLKYRINAIKPGDLEASRRVG